MSWKDLRSGKELELSFFLMKKERKKSFKKKKKKNPREQVLEKDLELGESGFFEKKKKETEKENKSALKKTIKKEKKKDEKMERKRLVWIGREIIYFSIQRRGLCL